MRPRTRPLDPAVTRVVGIALLGAALLGLVLSIIGLVLIFAVGARAEAAVLRELDVLDEALTTTSEGLVVAGAALTDTAQTINSLSRTFVSVSVTISETETIISTMADLTSEDLPQTINTTRQALDSAQATAQIVDGVLGSLSFFGLGYNPEVPLNEALGEVSNSLAPLPPALNEISRGLSTANRNLATVAEDLYTVTLGLDAIAVSVAEMTTVITRYELVIGSLQGEVALVRASVPGWFFAGRLGMSLLILWFAVAQLALFTRGWELLGHE